MRVVQKKVCLLGNFAVGKTSLIRQYVEGKFDDKYLSTIGVKISRKSLPRSHNTLNLLIWDLAGSDEFRHTSSSYLRGAVGALIVCDLTRPETLDALIRYAGQLQEINPEAAIILIGNKVDLVDERLITDEELAAVSSELKSPVHLTSAKTGENVEDSFLRLADLIEAKLS